MYFESIETENINATYENVYRPDSAYEMFNLLQMIYIHKNVRLNRILILITSWLKTLIFFSWKCTKDMKGHDD